MHTIICFFLPETLFICLYCTKPDLHLVSRKVSCFWQNTFLFIRFSAPWGPFMSLSWKLMFLSWTMNPDVFILFMLLCFVCSIFKHMHRTISCFQAEMIPNHTKNEVYNDSKIFTMVVSHHDLCCLCTNHNEVH